MEGRATAVKGATWPHGATRPRSCPYGTIAGRVSPSGASAGGEQDGKSGKAKSRGIAHGGKDAGDKQGPGDGVWAHPPGGSTRSLFEHARDVCCRDRGDGGEGGAVEVGCGRGDGPGGGPDRIIRAAFGVSGRGGTDDDAG